MNSGFGRLLGILVCGVIGALAGGAIVGFTALTGVPGALVAVAIAAFIATAAFVGWTTLGRALRGSK